ncbi:MAG: hypothetical protein AAF497_13785 [Planctomycetota bacterium]
MLEVAFRTTILNREPELSSMKRFICALAIGTIIAVTSSGCVSQRLYNPGPSATYFWIPGVGEWPINDPNFYPGNEVEVDSNESETQ